MPISPDDSLPSLADSSFTSGSDEQLKSTASKVIDDLSGFHTPINKNQTALSEEKETAEADRFPTKESLQEPIIVGDTPSTTTDSSSQHAINLIHSEFLNSPSINSPSNLHQQKVSGFHTSECVMINPVFVSPLDTTGESRRSSVLTPMIFGKGLEHQKYATPEESESPVSPFCIDGFVMRSPAVGFFHLFDISPQVWPGWSLSSPSQQTPEQQVEKTESTSTNITPSKSQEMKTAVGHSYGICRKSSIIESSPDISPRKVLCFDEQSPVNNSIHPVIEANSTPPRLRSKGIQADLRDDSRRQLISQFEDSVSSSPGFTSQTDSSTETAIASNLYNDHDIPRNKTLMTDFDWDHKVAELELACAALNEAVRCDSKTIMQLKADVEFLRSSKIGVPSYAKDGKKRLNNAIPRYSDTSTSRPTSKPRFEELPSTIPLSTRIELQQVQLENQLLVNHIVETERCYHRMENIIRLLEEENRRLNSTVQRSMTSTVGRKSEAKSALPTSKPHVLQRQADILANTINAADKNTEKHLFQAISRSHLNHSLVDDEDDIMSVSTDASQQKKAATPSNELGGVGKRTIEVWKSSDDDSNDTADDQVEVTLQGMIITTTTSPILGFNHGNRSIGDPNRTVSDDSDKENDDPQRNIRQTQRSMAEMKNRWNGICGCLRYPNWDERSI